MGLDKHGIFRHTYTVADGSVGMIQELGFEPSEIEIYNETTKVTTFLKGDMAASDAISSAGDISDAAHITKYDGGTVVLHDNGQTPTYKDSKGNSLSSSLYKDLEGRDSLLQNLPKLELSDSEGSQYITKAGFILAAQIYNTNDVIHVKAVR